MKKHIEITNFFKKRRIRILVFTKTGHMWVKPDESDFDVPFTNVEDGLFSIHSIDCNPTKVVLDEDFKNELNKIMDGLNVGERVFVDIENDRSNDLESNILKISKSSEYSDSGDE